MTIDQNPARTARPAAARAGRSRRLEPWRDCLVLGLGIHAVLIAAAVAQPRGLVLVPFGLVLGVGFGVGTLTVLHDAGHRMFGRRAWPNVVAVQLAVPAGLWVGHWTLKHRVHHRLSSVYPLDEATRPSGVLRLHPEAPLRRMHRHQHVYAWLLYSLAWAGELKSQLTFLIHGRIADGRAPASHVRVASFLLEKAIALAVLGPYVWRLGWTRTGLLLLLAECVGSLVAAVLTVIGHVNVGLGAPPGRPGREWAAHLVATTASFSTGSPLVRFWTGGLTHHLAHHLRPTALRSELPGMHEGMVRELVADCGVPSTEFPTLRAALAAHHQRLRELGTGPVRPLVTAAALPAR